MQINNHGFWKLNYPQTDSRITSNKDGYKLHKNYFLLQNLLQMITGNQLQCLYLGTLLIMKNADDIEC
ncbi:hypothetical protein pb186bvf_013926 [Paramecium bursaria]